MFSNRHTDIAMPLIRFLIDRIDDDESTLDTLARRESRGPVDSADFAGVRAVERLRGDLIAKRHILGDLQQLVVLRDLPVEVSVRQHAVAALAAMAGIYRHHPAYRAEWSAWSEATPPPESRDPVGSLQSVT